MRAQRATALDTEGVGSGGWVAGRRTNTPALRASSFATPLSSKSGVNYFTYTYAMNDTNFVYRPMPHFSRKLDQVEGVDPPGYSRISKVIDRLLVDPSNADGKMRGLYNGRFKKYVGRKDYRLIYYWCHLCRKENQRLEQKCAGCDELPDNSVIFFDLYHKKDMKKFKEL